jgi:hypothetical protein
MWQRASERMICTDFPAIRGPRPPYPCQLLIRLPRPSGVGTGRSRVFGSIHLHPILNTAYRTAGHPPRVHRPDSTVIMLRSSVLLSLLALLLAPGAAASQGIEVRRVAPRDVPRSVVYRGEVEGARQWRDRLGDNLLLLARTDELPVLDEYGQDAKTRELYAYHYVREGAGYRLLWQTTDFVRVCGLDIVLDFAPGSLQVTDVDADGTAETSYVYTLACRGGVDPSDMKLILHEGAAKYAIRGSTDMRPLGPGYPPPSMEVDAALARNPVLRAHAERQWRRFVRETAPPAEGPP